MAIVLIIVVVACAVELLRVKCTIDQYVDEETNKCTSCPFIWQLPFDENVFDDRRLRILKGAGGGGGGDA